MKSLKMKLFSLGLKRSGKKSLDYILKGTDNPLETQRKTLMHILRSNASTDLGQSLRISGLKSVEEFQKQVPIHEYEDIRPFVDQSLKGKADSVVRGTPNFYASTSGSTGKPKYIPISRHTELVTNKAFSKATAYLVYQAYPEAFAGKVLHITGAVVEEQSASGTPIGSATGNVVNNANRIVRSKYALPAEVYSIADAHSKYYAILLYSLDQDITLAVTANPSTLLVLAQKMGEWQEQLISDIESGLCSHSGVPSIIQQKLKRKPNPKLAERLRDAMASDFKKQLRPQKVWPNLKVLGCWTGGNCANYLSRLPEYYGDVSIKDPGYLASELRGSLPLRLNDPSGVLSINDNFFEFIKVSDIERPEPRIYLAHELEKGQQYYIFVTNYCGLYRYNIHDIIEVTGFYKQTPEIIFVQKGKGITSISGEKLYEQQVLQAISGAVKKLGIDLLFHITFANVKEGRYQVFIDPCDKGKDLTRILAQEIDSLLQLINNEYKSKRTSMRLHPVEVIITLPNAYERFKAWRVGQGVRESQYKMVHLTQDETYLQAIRAE